MTDTNREPDPNSAEQPDLELSVIIPARNEERSLPNCLASLLIQSEPGFTLGHQWEIIIVNDDSTDKTREVGLEAAATHDGVIPPLHRRRHHPRNQRYLPLSPGSGQAQGGPALLLASPDRHRLLATRRDAAGLLRTGVGLPFEAGK